MESVFVNSKKEKRKMNDYEIKRAWNTFSFEFEKILNKMRSETEMLFIKIFNELTRID